MPILSFFILGSVPAVRLAYRDHGFQNVVPGLRIGHHRIGKHAAVPANVGEGASHLAPIVAHPGACVANDVQLSLRIEGLTVPPRLVMRTGAADGSVIL